MSRMFFLVNIGIAICSQKMLRRQVRILIVLRPGVAVDLGADAGASAADRRADFEAHHRQRALAMPDHNLAEENLAKTRDREAMSDPGDARAFRFHFLDAGTKDRSVRLYLVQGRAVFKRFLCYFAEFPIFCKLFPGLLEGWHLLEQLDVQLDIGFASGDAEILKLAADRGDRTLRFVREMFGIKAGHNAIGSDHVEEIETFDRGGHQRVVAAIVLVGAGNVRVAFTERNKLAKPKVLNARAAMASDNGKRTGCLYVDSLVERTGEIAAKGMSTSMVVKSANGFGAHLVTLLN